MNALNPQDFAIVIGINEYADAHKNLSSPVEDARAVMAWLTDPNGGGLDPAHCRALYGYSGPDGQKATQQAIEDLLLEAKKFSKSLKNNVLKARRLYFYFSGHGLSGGTDVLMCHALWGNDRPNANLNTDSIDKDYINPCTYFDETVFWLDCCRSLALSAKPGSLQVGCGLPRDGANQQKTMMAFATLDNTDAYEALNDQENYSVFTQALLTGLSHATGEGGKVTWRSLAKYLEEYVPTIAANNQRSQTPVIMFPRLQQTVDPVFCEGNPTIETILRFNRDSGLVKILNSNFDSVGSYELSAGSLNIELELGKYMAMLGEEQAVFEVDGLREDIHVGF